MIDTREGCRTLSSNPEPVEGGGMSQRDRGGVVEYNCAAEPLPARRGLGNPYPYYFSFPLAWASIV
jgi:hypothetical protein